MIKSGEGDVLTVLFAILGGIALCIVYDILRTVRYAVRHKSYAVFLEDVLFAFISAIVTFFILYTRVQGEVRAFVIASEFLGFLLMRLTLSRIFMKGARHIVRFIKRSSLFIKTRIMQPIAEFFGNISKKSIKFFAKILKNMLQRIRGLLYNKKIKRQKEKEKSNG